MRWYGDYACRDDYGLSIEDTSAWAMMFYFAARTAPAFFDAFTSSLTAFRTSRSSSRTSALGAPPALARNSQRKGLVSSSVLVFLAFVEEALWDRWVWHDHVWLFGHGVALGVLASTFVVPLLAVPQATHYVLDGMIWRRREQGFVR